MFCRVIKGIYQFAANLLSYIPAKYYWNRSTSDLVIAKSRRVDFFWNTVYYGSKIVQFTTVKNRHFYVPQPTFLFPLDAPETITQYIAWIERQFNACQTPRSTYLSIFNNFRVIRCLSQCVTPKIAIFYILVSPGDAPGAITLNVVCMEREFDAYKLSRSTHLSSTISQLFELQVQKIAVFTYRSPHFCFTWRRPCDYHAIYCTDGKTIQCLPNPSQHVPICLQ